MSQIASPAHSHFRWLSMFPGGRLWSLVLYTLRWSNRDFQYLVWFLWIEFHLLIPQCKAHGEQSDRKVMTCHQYQMNSGLSLSDYTESHTKKKEKTQSPSLTAFSVWPHTPWHFKTSLTYARALSSRARPLELFIWLWVRMWIWTWIKF